MATVHLTGTAKDSLNTTATATATKTSAVTPAHTVRRYFHKDRIQFTSVVDVAHNGPTLGHDVQPYEVGLIFHLQRTATFKGTRIYKVPAITGTIPVTLWDYTAHTALSTTTVTWTVDDGGWRDIPMPAVDLAAGHEYAVSYYAATGDFALTTWMINGQDYIEYPFAVYNGDTQDSNGNYLTPSCANGGSHAFPAQRNGLSASWYWIDPYVEWTATLPAYTGGASYYSQWPNAGFSASQFPIGVFAADAGTLSGYNTLGITHYVPGDGLGNLSEVLATNLKAIVDLDAVQTVVADPTGWGSRVAGYYVHDEPDLIGSFLSPAAMRTSVNTARTLDSTRPMWLNFGTPAATGQGFYFLPTGGTIYDVHANFRAWATCADMLSLDFYTICLGDGTDGIWQYGLYIDRLRHYNDDATPIWGFIETNNVSGNPHNPTSAEIISAMWMQIIHGATGIWFFDHQFAAGTTPQDFQVLLHDSTKNTAIKAAITKIQSMAAACWAPEAGLCTGVTSSNVTAGPIGGFFGVPIDLTTRDPGTGTKYLFAIAARPGSTTATFTVPTAASKTITVVGESRTLTANSSGVFTDTIGSYDYEYHCYSWV